MMIWTTRFTRKKAVLSVLMLGAVLAFAITLAANRDAAPAEPPVLKNNEARVEYLHSLGWEVQPEPLETLQFQMPETLEEPYLSYQELQEAQGFDFTRSCGKQVSRYTYAVTNYPGRSEGVQANLYTCEGHPVGGDIFCAGADGFQDTLVYPEYD